MTQMTIDITSDVVCPFCLIGVKQLLAAIEQYKQSHPTAYTDYTLRLLPYQLNAALTETPMPRLKYYAEKFGKERADQIVGSMAAKYEAVGCKSDFSGEVSSSHLAHRLQTYALLHHPSAQLSLALDIFSGFHCERKHPSDKEWLASLAAKHEIFPSAQDARSWLDGDGCDAEVKESYAAARKMGVTGVPFFAFQDKYAASGAMGTEAFVQLLEEINQRDVSAS